jgi:D-alanine-D-alanine ligase
MKSKRVGVLMGGVSAAREMSLRTGEGVAAALESRGHDVRALTWSPEGPTLDEVLREALVDVVFVALHGRGGDGCAQGLLEVLGLPYTGSGVLASALAMDKLKSKEMFRLHNLPTPPYYLAGAPDLDDIEDVHGTFGFPVIVKPRADRLSHGALRADGPHGLAAAIEQALVFDTSALVERHVKAMEVSVGILDGRVLGAVEVVAAADGPRDLGSPDVPGGKRETISPPRLAPTRLRGVTNLAERAVRALGCSGACRVDLLVTEGENEYVLEVEPLPELTPVSLMPRIAEAAGIDYASLCEAILAGASVHAPLRLAAARAAHAREARRSGVFLPATERLSRINSAR